jgi:hypothetical protein
MEARPPTPRRRPEYEEAGGAAVISGCPQQRRLPDAGVADHQKGAAMVNRAVDQAVEPIKLDLSPTTLRSIPTSKLHPRNAVAVKRTSAPFFSMRRRASISPRGQLSSLPLPTLRARIAPGQQKDQPDVARWRKRERYSWGDVPTRR